MEDVEEKSYDPTLAAKKKIISLRQMMTDQGESYYTNPIAPGKVLRIIVKREKGEEDAGTRYFFHDS